MEAEVFSSLVLLLGYFQWVDLASLECVRTLVANVNQQAGVPGLMVVGTYRSTEVDETHVLSKMIQDLKNSTTETHITNATTLLEAGGETEQARYRLNESIRHFSEWGAHHKVGFLKDAHAALLHRSKEINLPSCLF